MSRDESTFHQESELQYSKISLHVELVNCTVALGSTQPLTEMSTSNLPAGKRRPARKTDNLTAICEPIV
jgi:hypothetical protein